MKETLIKEIEQSLLRILDNAQMKALHETLTNCFKGVEVTSTSLSLKEICKYTNEELIERFISSKEIDG